MTSIIVRSRFERLHRWVQPPEEVSFLKEYHRHEFHIELEIEVFHDDRELEFILVKRALESWLELLPEKSDLSCEQIASLTISWVKSKYHSERFISCSVFEDGENGARVTA